MSFFIENEWENLTAPSNRRLSVQTLTTPLKLHWSIDRMKIGRNIGVLRHPLCVHCPLFTSIES
ncbi:hypothetical protein ACSFCR_14010, partial [Enterococcus faecalis]